MHTNVLSVYVYVEARGHLFTLVLSPTLWVMGIEFRMLDLAATAFTH